MSERAGFQGADRDGGVGVAEPPDVGIASETPPFPTSANPPGMHPMARRRTRRPQRRQSRGADGPWAQLPLVFGAAIVAGLVLLGFEWRAYNDTSIDPRSTISAPAAHRGEIAKFINRSALWKPYLERESPSGTTKLVRFELVTERRRVRSRGGDYDPGNVNIVFRATNLKTDETLFEREMKVAIDEVLVGRFDDDATRDEIQEIAFRDAEEKFLPYLDRWIDLAAIEAMGQRGASGRAYLAHLQEIVDDEWSSEELAVAAENAIDAIQG